MLSCLPVQIGLSIQRGAGGCQPKPAWQTQHLYACRLHTGFFSGVQMQHVMMIFEAVPGFLNVCASFCSV
ncbi:hypothetical protein AZ09_12115 [Acetobacter aceti 1023]|nr:hypothetical protein AZ09_12115 [Acetobacter aceti 1023]